MRTRRSIEPAPKGQRRSRIVPRTASVAVHYNRTSANRHPFFADIFRHLRLLVSIVATVCTQLEKVRAQRNIAGAMNGLLLLLLCAVAGGTQARAGEDNRRVLALFDSRKYQERRSNAHLFFEMPLNRLGLTVEYADVNRRPLPDARLYRAIVVWFTDTNVPQVPEYLRWLKQAADSGVRLIVVSGFGVNLEGAAASTNWPLVQETLAAMGMNYGTVPFLIDPFLVTLKQDEPDAFGFELRQPMGPLPFYNYRIVNPDAMKPWLTVVRTDLLGSESVAVAAGKRGGFISDHQLSGSDIDSPVWHYRWYLDPFRFLACATGLEETAAPTAPANLRPDVTTAFGCRAAFSHIDGDGMHNKTQDIPGVQRLAADVLYESILKRYPVPITVSYIAAETTKQGGADDEFLKKLRTIMALPNVTPAAHGYTHPMIWSQGILGLKIPGYTYDAKMETAGAIDLVTQNTCPPDKPAELMLWTGDCHAPEDALAALDARGFLNMNGGDPRRDRVFNSVSCISALSVQVGARRQIYAAACNEYLYTDGWKENYGGYVSVLETFKNTTEPRYLPVNIYYHNYLCERQAGLISLQRVYNWALAQELCWLTAPEYVRSVQAFLAARTGFDNDLWWIENYAGLHTVRLDNESRHVDFKRSKRVAGYTHFAGSLYISLQSGPRAEIALQAAEGADLYIKRSTGLLRDLSLQSGRIAGQVRLFPAGFIEVGGKGGQPLRATIGGKPAQSQSNDGKIILPAGNGEWVAFEIVRGS